MPQYYKGNNLEHWPLYSTIKIIFDKPSVTMKFLKHTVALKDVKCFALHGYYQEEQLIGGYFMVDLITEFTPIGFDDDLKQTVNYEDLNTIILAEMDNTQKLLETVLNNILSKVTSLYPFVEKVTVSIKKLSPPMPGQVGHSYVKLSFAK